MSADDNPFGIDGADVDERLRMLRSLVAQPVPQVDPGPGLVGDSIYVGNKYHAASVETLLRHGITAVLNCASSGIRRLPIDEYANNNIEYAFTNVAQDAHDYPILHDRAGVASDHLETAKAYYERVREAKGKVLFFCVAGQNRSATLAVAVQVALGYSLQQVLSVCSQVRPFVLENVGFQRQLVELEALHAKQTGTEAHPAKRSRLESPVVDDRHLIVELKVPGVRTFTLSIPAEATVDTVKRACVRCVNEHFAASKAAYRIGKAWLVFTSFAGNAEFNLLLEEEAVEHPVQVVRLQSSFGLEIVGDPSSADCRIRWDTKSRFELVLFSIVRESSADTEGAAVHEPFTFTHEERAGAPGTLLAESMIEPWLRAWDFVSGEAFRSSQPVVFSFADDARSKRDFINVSVADTGERQHFVEGAPGAGGLLGMGNNAIVHHVELESVIREEAPGGEMDFFSPPRLLRHESTDDMALQRAWDAAVKRPYSLAKMLASIENKAEAGVAKRLRMAGALNKQGRLLYFYGLGIALASNNERRAEYRFEATLLSQFQEDFSAYTLKSFMDDYTAVTVRWLPSRLEKQVVESLQAKFTLIKVKVLLVSLLNGFRDLTLMGVQAFDFNHLNNVLISRDYRKARLIDIDGASKGSIQFPSRYIEGQPNDPDDVDDSALEELHKPALDVDLSTLLPLVVQQLMFGKGRGKPFVDEQVRRVRCASSDEAAKALIRTVLCENFFPGLSTEAPAERDHDAHATHHKHLSKVVEWFYAVLLRRSPWSTWTDDIYDAMRCIDHLPIG